MRIKAIFLFFLVLSIEARDYQHKSIYELQELIEASDNKKLFIDDYLSYLETNDVINSINSLHSSNELYKSYVYSRRAPWRGVPIFIKDNIDSYGLANTAGSLLMSDNLPRDDAQLVKNLKKAGFLVVGKTNLSEWANFRGQRSVSGWSSFGGQTLNPYNLEYNPCGSSSGSAAVVAEGLAPVSIGTETNGSITCPASMNGVVGIKPTVGLVSRDGIIPISATQDTAGPMARTVLEAAEVLKAISGQDPKDPATRNIPRNYNYDALIDLDKNYLKDKRIGVIMLGNNASATEIELDKKVRENIAIAGGEIIDITFDAFTDDDWSKALFLLFYEFNNGLNEYLKKSNSEHKSIDDIIENNLKREDEILKYFGQELMIESSKAAKGKIYEGEKSELIYANATAVTLKAQSIINKTLEDNSIDLIVGLTRNPAWKIDYENGDNFSNSWGNGSLSAIAGYPHITIPLSYVEGLPVGVSFMASSWEESKLINAAFAFEHVNNFTPRPIRDTK